jgi:hypothetical protein
VLVYIIFSVDTIHYAGDHVSSVALTPLPSLSFSYGGGEQGDSSIANLPEWYLQGCSVFLYESC